MCVTTVLQLIIVSWTKHITHGRHLDVVMVVVMHVVVVVDVVVVVGCP